MKGWSHFTSCLVGNDHKANGTPCQDAVLIQYNPDNNRTVMVLADGLGSKSLSHIAAEQTVKSVSQYLLRIDQFTDNIKQSLIDTCTQTIQDYASTHNLNINDMDCTLLFVVVASEKLIVGQIGDGAICMLRNTGFGEVAHPHKQHIASSTQTIFSHDATASLNIKDYQIETIDAVIITSDGLESDCYFHNSREVCKNAGIHATHVAKSEEYKLQERLSVLQNHGYDDDISIGIIARQGVEVRLPNDPYWLCDCDQKNPMQRTMCKNCRTHFMDVYREFDFSHIDDLVSMFRIFNHYYEYIHQHRRLSITPTASQYCWWCNCGNRNEDNQSSCAACNKDISLIYNSAYFSEFTEFTNILKLLNQYEKDLDNEEQNVPYWRCTCSQKNALTVTLCSKCSQSFDSIYAQFDFQQTDKTTTFQILNRYDSIVMPFPYSTTHQRPPKIDTKDNASSNKTNNKNKLSRPRKSVYQLIWICVSGLLLIVAVCCYVLLSQSSTTNQTFNVTSTPSYQHNQHTYTSSYTTRIVALIDQYGVGGVYQIDAYGYIVNDDGSYYNGEVENGKANGVGVVYNPDGSIIKGVFRNGYKRGWFEVTDTLGNTSRVKYENDIVINTE
jgi:serine/threonine protein phosphatase PrpC